MKATIAAAMLGCMIPCIAGAEEAPHSSVSFEFGTTLNAVLSDTVDARKSKPGDVVKARTSEDLKAAGAVLIPRGTKLLGHVTQSQTAHAVEGAVLGVTFDRAELKDGQEIPLHTGVYALAAPEGAANGSSDSSPGGGFGGGFGSGSSGAGSIVSTSGHAAADETSDPGAGGGKQHETLKPSPGAIGGLNNSGTLYASSRGVFGIDDVRLQNGTEENGSSPVIVSRGRSVRLASGTRMLLSVESATIPNRSDKS